MRRDTIYLITAIASDTPEEFEKLYNDKMTLLSEYNPKATIDLSDGFKAVIQYETVKEEIETIKDKYNLEGIRYFCRECPLHDIEKDSRRKWVSCRYSETNETHLDHECCEYFYEQLKLGLVRPGEPNKSGSLNKATARK